MTEMFKGHAGARSVSGWLRPRLGALGAAGWLLFLSLCSGAALAQVQEQVVVFGPKLYLSGPPVVRTDSFTLPAGVRPPYLVRVQNGDGAGNQRMKQAMIQINSQVIVAMNAFPGGTAAFEAAANLAAYNSLKITVPTAGGNNNPGQFTLTILGTRDAPVPIAVSPDPLTITSGAAGTITVALSPAPASAGSLGLSSSDAGVAAVSGAVPFAAGQSAVAAPVSGIGAGSAIVSASLNGGTASGTVHVTPRPPTVTSLLPASLQVTQGAMGALTATISSAQATDTVLALATSNSGVVHVPAAATVPAGQTSIQVPVSALNTGTTQVSASLNGVSATSQITVTPAPPTVVSLVPTTSTVHFEAIAALELTLSSAQATPTVVQLAASPAGVVDVPASVSVPAGELKAAISVAAIGFGQASVVASLNGTSATAAVQVVPLAPQVTSLQPATLSMTAGASGQFTVTLNAVQPGSTEIALEADPPAILQVPQSVTVAAGKTSASFVVTGLAQGDALLAAWLGTSEQTAQVHVAPQPANLVSLLPNPMPLQQGATGSLTVSIDVAQEADTAVAIANSAPALVQVPLAVTVPAGQLSAVIPVAALAPGSAQVTASVNGTSAAAVVEVSPPPPVVTGIEPATRMLAKGAPGTLRVNVSRAPNTATAVQLSSGSPSVASVPPTVTIPAGALSAEFPVTALQVGQAVIRASLNGGTASATITVVPAELVALSVAPQAPTMYATDTQAFSATGTLTDNTTQDFTPQSAWSSSDPAVASVALGAVSALAPGTTTLSAAYTYTNSQGAVTTISGATLLTVKAASALTLSAPASSLYVGQSMPVTVTAADPAGPQGLMVSLAATGGVSVPQTVFIGANQSQASFTVTATALAAATLTASAAGRLPGSLTLAVLAPFSITGLTPASGPVGTPVTISGAGFDPNTAGNEVRFNGERAIVGAASAMELRVIVPIKATSGPVTVTTASGTATSPTPFTVQPLQGFDLSVAPAAVQIPRNGTTTVRVRLESLGLSPYAHGVALGIGGLPAGISVRLEPAQLSAASDVIATFTADGSVAPGDYALSVSGTGPLDIGSAVRSKPLTLTVLAADATTVSGRVLHADDDTPFVGARIRLGTQHAFTDETGLYRFVNPTLLGDQVVLIDGHTNNTATTAYPSAIPMPVMIIAGGDNKVLTSYIQAIDAGKYTTIVPGEATSITNPDIPDYALNIPQGAVLMGWDGTPITKVSVRTVPADKLPIKPVPEGVNTRTVYLYYFFREGGANPSVPIPVTMANDLGALPGEKADLWYFDESPTPDANSNQWRIMGQGTVSEDGRSIVSDPGVGIPKFCCGASMASPAPPPVPPATCPDPGPSTPNPINFGTGVASVMQDHSLGINGLFPVRLSCNYNSRAARVGPFGRGTWINTEWQVARGTLALTLMSPAGHRYNLAKGADGVYRTTPGPTGADGVEASVEGALTVVRFPEGTRYEFAGFGRGNQVLVAQTDANGNRITLTRGATGLLQSATDANGRITRLEYAGSLIARITDPIGRTLGFTYDGAFRLTEVAGPTGAVTRYAYDGANRIVQKTDPRGAVTRYEYDAGGRAVKEVFADNATYGIDYTVAGNQIFEARVTDPRGNLTAYRFNGLGNLVRSVDPLGAIRLRTLEFASNRTMAETDPLGRTTRYTYDVRGNRTSVKDALGHFTLTDYDPLFNKPTTIKDALGNTTTSIYDAKGNLASSTNGEGETTRYTYTPQGQLQTATDPLGRVARFDYDGEGNLVRTSDPLGNASDMTFDAANRLASLTTPRGETSRYGYDALDRQTQLIDALSGVTAYAYDANDNLVSVTDPLGHSIETNVYDLRNRLTRRTDAKAMSTSYQYDLNGNVVQATDRRGRTTAFEYDALNRPSKATDADGRITQFYYDLAGNISRISDSVSGEILQNYDELNRLVRIATDQGSVEYAFDALGRRIRRTVNGTDATDTTYDRANRVKSIAFRGKTVAYQYDAAGRLTKKALPNGIVQEYAWDEANRLKQIQYKKSDNTLIETLAYAYDANGERIQKDSGATSLRETGFNAQYDEANRLTQLTLDPGAANAKTYALAYDENGSLVAKTNLQDASDKTTYAWDAKNRLTAIQGPGVQAAFKYDALGRRIERTVNGETVGYLYDGAQAIAELNGSAIVAAYHTGIELDEVLARHAASGSRTLLQDALGSVIAQTRDDQTVQNGYAYTPYGEVQRVGDDDKNPIQYTGRENDGTGLYYYRARYYDAVLKRFISSDPIGLAGGLNTYTYVNGNPVGDIDPLGLMGSRGSIRNTGGLYGCWGGANWSGCKSGPDIPEKPYPPTDAYDACYKQHDYCYAAAQNASQSCSINQPTISDCDTQLARCNLAIDPKSIKSWWGKVFGPLSTTWAVFHGELSK